MAEGKILFTTKHDIWFLKLIGDLRYSLGPAFDALIDRLHDEENLKNVLIDLTEAVSIDSTNFGLLARIARMTWNRSKRRPVLISTNSDINMLLESMGFDQAFELVDDPQGMEESLDQIPSVDASRDEKAGLMLRAHQELIRLDEKNRDVFQNVVDLLEKGISKKKR
ncbi:STAS domain-containing protein [bacterium]|nr:STAS domain-containing protein [bacterium]